MAKSSDGSSISVNIGIPALRGLVYDIDGKTIKGYQPVSKEEQVNNVASTPVIPPLSTGPVVPQGSVTSTEYVPIDEEEYTNEEYMDQVAPKKNGGKLNKKYSQSSIVRAFK